MKSGEAGVGHSLPEAGCLFPGSSGRGSEKRAEAERALNFHSLQIANEMIGAIIDRSYGIPCHSPRNTSDI